MRLGHIRPFKVMAMTSLHLANLPTKSIFFIYCLQRCIGQFGLKKCMSGHRPCPIAYNVFKVFKVFKMFKVLQYLQNLAFCYQTL